ncbi:MAG TPA: sugar MFS transporter [Puia sp.]|jgi:fucose permease
MLAGRNRPILIIGALFFVFGFVTWLGAVLIPYLRIACRLNSFASYLVAFYFYISYAIAALPAGYLLRRTGYRKGMALGLLIMSVGAALFIPAAMTRYYPLFLAGLFVLGSGLALLQTASNPYITIIGPLESAARRIGIMGICNGIAGVVAPLILGAIILQDADAVKLRIARASPGERIQLLDELARRVIVPYGIMTVVLLLLAAWVYYSRLPEPAVDGSPPQPADHSPVSGPPPAGRSPLPADLSSPGRSSLPRTSILQFPHLLLGAFTLFLYVGVEVIAGDMIINYGYSQGIPLSAARFFTSYTLALMLLGYILGIILIPKYLSQVSILKISGMLGIGFACMALCTNGYLSVMFIACLGLANAMVWPSIWPLAIEGLGKFTNVGASLLILAIGGGALLPMAYGWLAEMMSPQRAYLIVIPCYGCIWYYAVAGHKIRLPLKTLS